MKKNNRLAALRLWQVRAVLAEGEICAYNIIIIIIIVIIIISVIAAVVFAADRFA